MKILSALRRRVAQHFTNISGWKTNRKIVVIESDDWGSVRMPSKDAYHRMQEKGIPVEKSPYCLYDSLASEKDLIALFDILTRYKDQTGNPPVFTANSVVSNPDFDRIGESNFQTYYCEPISETFKKYPEHARCLALWKQGQADGVFHPQSHGKEHLNTIYWMELLRNDKFNFRTAFENKCWGLSSDIYPDMKRSVQASFDCNSLDDFEAQAESVRNGLHLFEKIFGYRSESFIANNYIWSVELNKVLADEGVRYLQGMKYQKLPMLSGNKRELIRHFVGEKNDHGQIYLIRNCVFEPSLKPSAIDHVTECLKGISTAFFWNCPAIICSHRLNYVGFLNPENRETNLELFNVLLKEILHRWPDVEFMTSDQLGRTIEADNAGTS